ncbi:MAG: sigma-70 family RNA polymerase sigma factor [Microthrixaceae bacterium]
MAVVLEIMVERQSAERSGVLRADEFAEVYRRSYTPLVEHCRKRLGAGDDAEDIAQAALLKAWDSWESYDKERPFWPWVVTIAQRMAIDMYRRSARCDASNAVGSRLADGVVASPEDAIAARADTELALAALRQLRPRQQRLIGLRDLEGWTYEELAAFEGASVDHVRRHTHRARIALRASYLRVSQRMAGLAAMVPCVKARRRLSLFGSRVRTSMATAPPVYDFGMQALSGLAVLALALTAVDGRPSDTTPVVARFVAPTALAAPAVARPTAATSRTPVAARVPTSDEGALAELGLDNVAVPEDAAFDAFTPTRNGTTVYAAGSGRGGCQAARCPAIFRSDDAGATWSRLAADGYLGGVLLIPPAHPADGRIFVAGPFGLQVSEDGGRRFTNITDVGGPAAMSPGFSDGDPRILIGAAPGWVYNDADKSVTPLTSLSPPPASLTRTFAFSPSYGTDGRVLVGGTRTPLGGTDVSTVTLCDAESCLSTAALDSLSGAPEILVSPGYAADGVVFAWRSNGLYRSNDGGHSFAKVALPTDGFVEMVVSDGRDGFMMVMSARLNGHAGGGIFASADGLSWSRVPLAVDDVLAAIRIGPRLIAAPAWTAGGGLRCSEDRGASWRTRCGDEATR